MLSKLLGKFKNDKLLKSGTWYTIGNFLSQGLSFISIFIFTNLLSTEEYGIVSLYGSWLSTFSIIVSLDLVASVGRGKFDFKEHYNNFLSSIMSLASVSFIVFLSLGIIFRGYLSDLTGLTPTLGIMLIIQSFFAFVISFMSSKYTIEYEYKKYLILSITNSVGNLLLSIFLVLSLNKNKYMGRIQGGFYITIIYGLILFYLVMKNGKIRFNKKYCKYALLIAIPLIPHSLSSVILSQFDRIMISKTVGNSANGIYSFAANIASILSVVWAALNNAWIPYFFENMDNENYGDIRKKYKYYIGIFTLITFSFIFVSPEIVKILSYRSKAYWGCIGIIPIFVLGNFFVFLYSLPSNLEFYMKKTHLISVGTFGAGFLNILLNAIFIPKYGYIAAAWTTLISYIALFIYHYAMAYRIGETQVFEIKYFIVSVVFIGASSGVFYVLKDKIIVRYALVLLVFLFLAYKIKNIIKTNILK